MLLISKKTQNTALLNGECYVLKQAHFQALDALVASFARAAMRGTAHPENDGKSRSLPTQQVLRHWRLVCAETELRVRRLRWLAVLVGSPRHHLLAWASLLGDLQVEEGVRSTLCTDGSPSQDANPWLRCLMADLEVLAEQVDDFHGSPLC